METFESILLGVGLLIILGFFVVAIWRSKKHSDDEVLETEEPTVSEAQLAEHGVEAETIEPIIVGATPAEPKAVSEEFESAEPTISSAAVMSDDQTTQHAAEYADEDEFAQNRIKAAGQAAVDAAKENAKTGSRKPFGEKEWMNVIRQSFKQRTKTNEAIKKERTGFSNNLVVIYVVAPRGKSFYGADIAELLENQGLQFGRMDVFHKLDDFGREVFSIASAVEPGTFDYDNMTLSSTPGLCCFFDLDHVVNPKQSFRCLLSCVYELSHFLRADLLDDSREALSQDSVTATLSRIKANIASKTTVNPGTPINVE